MIVELHSDLFPFGQEERIDFLNSASLSFSPPPDVVVTLATGQTFGAPVNLPPVANAGPDQMVECASPTGTAVRLDGSGSHDPDGDLLSFAWKDASGGVFGDTAVLDLTLPLGMHIFTLTVNDGRGGMATDEVVVQARDITAPDIGVSASPSLLRPPNHRMVAVNAAAVAADRCDAAPACRIVAVTSNEPVDGLGDGTTAPDWEITGASTVNLRAERSGPGSGRVYTITLQCTDASGNSATGTATVTVPHDRR